MITGSKSEVLEKLNRDHYLFDRRPLLLKLHDKWVFEKAGTFEKQLSSTPPGTGSVFFFECVKANDENGEYHVEIKSVKVKIENQ